MKAAKTVVLAISLALLGSFTCSKNQPISSIELIYNYPASLYKEKDEIKIYNIQDTIRIFYYGDYVLYQLSASRKFETDEIIAGTEQFFIFKRDNKYGFLIPSIGNSALETKFQVDSFLSNRGMKGKDFDLLPDSSWSLIDETKDKESNVIERYAPIKPGDEASIDSIYYYYTRKMNDVQYSLSKKLDSVKSMKLFKVRMIYNEKFSKPKKITLPRREVLFEIRKIQPKDPEKINGLFERFLNQQRS